MSKFTKTRTTDQAINDFTSIHGAKYDYSKYEYSKAREKSTIICHLHGEFTMTYNHHFNRGQNCPSCAHNKKQNTIDCIEIFKSVHGHRYDYSLVDYKGNRRLVEIICKIHGVFEQEPLSHKSGRNCPDCSREKSIIDWNENLNIIKNIHGDRYDYSLSEYTKTESKIKIICPEHGVFEQRVSMHKIGRGCQECARISGWHRTDYIKASSKHNGKSHLYICEMSKDSELFYKIGICFTGFTTRYRKRIKDIYNMELINEYIGDAELIWNLEHLLHRELKQFKHKPSVSFAGETECFLEISQSFRDIIQSNLDNGSIKEVFPK